MSRVVMLSCYDVLSVGSHIDQWKMEVYLSRFSKHGVSAMARDIQDSTCWKSGQHLQLGGLCHCHCSWPDWFSISNHNCTWSMKRVRGHGNEMPGKWAGHVGREEIKDVWPIMQEGDQSQNLGSDMMLSMRLVQFCNQVWTLAANEVDSRVRKQLLK